MDYFDKARDLYNQAVKAVSKTETEKKLAEALSNANWGASTTLLSQISNLTHDYQEYSVVMRELYQTLAQPPKYWRQIFKALTLLEYLVKNGAERCVQEAKDRVHLVRTLTGFSYYHEGNERGTGVREKAKSLVELLGDNDMIKEEREKAKLLRDKYTGIGRDGVSRSTGMPGSSGGYDGSGGLGRYNDEDSFGKSSSPAWDEPSKKKKDKKKKKKHKNYDDDDDDFDFGEPEEDTKKKSKKGKKSKKKDVDPFADDASDDDFNFGDDNADDDFNFDDDEEVEKKKSKGKKKKKKDKSKSKKKQDDDDDLFGSAPSPPSGGDPSFDPFNSPSGGAGGDDEWSGFEAAAPPQAPRLSGDNAADMGFGDFNGTPAASGSNDAFGDFAQASTSTISQPGTQQQASPGNNVMDLFGGSQPSTTSAAPSMMMQQTPQQPMQMNMMMGGGATGGNMMGGMSQPQQMQQQPVKQSSGGGDPWAGLVDLGNLSLNDTKGAPQQQQQRNSIGNRRLSSGSTGSGGMGMMMSASPQQQQPMMMGGMQQPMGMQQQPMGMGGMPMQPMMGGMQPMQQQQPMMGMGQPQQQQQQQQQQKQEENLLF